MKPIIRLPWTSAEELEFRVEIHLVRPNMVLQRRFKFLPLLRSGVRYRREPEGEEEWRCIDRLYQVGFGDCEDLAAAYVAQTRVRAETLGLKRLGARVVIHQVAPGLRHARAEISDGGRITIVDPSKVLGMGGEG